MHGDTFRDWILICEGLIAGVYYSCAVQQCYVASPLKRLQFINNVEEIKVESKLSAYKKEVLHLVIYFP